MLKELSRNLSFRQYTTTARLEMILDDNGPLTRFWKFLFDRPFTISCVTKDSRPLKVLRLNKKLDIDMVIKCLKVNKLCNRFEAF